MVTEQAVEEMVERARALREEFERVRRESVRAGARYRLLLMADELGDLDELAAAAEVAILEAGKVAGYARALKKAIG